MARTRTNNTRVADAGEPVPPEVRPVPAIEKDRWQRLKELFEAALELSPEERRGFVERACADDPPLLAELRSLLAAHESVPAFLELPALAGGLRVAPDPLIGTIIEGRYEIVERIGGGGMGVVYRARHLGFDSWRAIKVMGREWLAQPGFVQRFENEAKMAEALVHPHLVRVYDTARLPDGALCIVSEYVDGETLARRLRQRGAFPPAEALRIVAQIAEGMELAHSRGVVHRDIAPDNVLVYETSDGLVAKLIDFGIAKDLGRTEERLTGSGLLLGKLGYASPEQMGLLPCGTQPDTRTDVFSLATVLYEMLTGTLPWRKDGVQSYVHDLLVRREQEVCDAVVAPLPVRWRSFFLQALARDRQVRTPSMRALKEGAARCADPTIDDASWTDETQQPTLAMPKRAQMRRRWMGAGLLGFAGVLTAAAMTVRAPVERPPHTSTGVRPASVERAAPVQLPTARALDVRDRTASPVKTPAAAHATPALPSSSPAPAPPAPVFARLVLQSATAASVTLDGQPRGRAPLVIEDLPPGRHLLVMTADDGRVVEEELVLAPGETLERRLRFPGHGSLSVVSSSWAEVRLGDGPAQETPCRFERVPAGRHRLSATRDGYRPHVQDIDIAEGESRQVRVDLEKEP